MNRSIGIYVKIVISIVLFIGILLRLWLAIANPSNNTYDDHLEVISLVAQGSFMPAPQQCWECYQPPLFYATAAGILNFGAYAGLNSYDCWKALQLLNVLASVGVLFVLFLLLRLLKVPSSVSCLFLAFWTVLPVDIYISAMITNDSFLMFFTALSIYFFCRIKMKEAALKSDFYFLNLSVLLACLTKQHGMILLLMPAMILIPKIKFGFNRRMAAHVFIFAIIVVLSLSNEMVRFHQSGKWLVSNQEYFDYTSHQGPGTVDKVDFFSFRAVALMHSPFLSEATLASLPTELFARTWNDYEPLYSSRSEHHSVFMARVSYVMGMFWICFFISIPIIFLMLKFRQKKWKSDNPTVVTKTNSSAWMVLSLV